MHWSGLFYVHVCSMGRIDMSISRLDSRNGIPVLGSSLLTADDLSTWCTTSNHTRTIEPV